MQLLLNNNINDTIKDNNRDLKIIGYKNNDFNKLFNQIIAERYFSTE